MSRSYTATKPYKIEAPDGQILTGHWFRSESTYKKDLKNGDIRFVKKQKGGWSVQFKQRMPEGKKIRSLLTSNEFKSDASAFEEFDLPDFDYPKPVSLIQYLLQGVTSHDDIVLDSFAGSAPTAQAVLALNKEDGGNRRFILIECEDYADSLTAERVRRVIRGVPKAKDEALKKGLGGTFSYFELGKPLELRGILDGSALPSYKELARYVFYTATGEEFNEKAVKAEKHFIGESSDYQVFLYYESDVKKLKNLAFTLDMAKALPVLKKGKRRLVFAPTKYLDQEMLDQFSIDFAQLPYEIYELTR